MIKLHTGLSKKIPIVGQDYSNRTVSAGLEVELSDGATRDQIQARIKDNYSLLEESIDAQISSATAFGAKPEDFNPPAEQTKPPVQQQPPAPASGNNGNGQKNGSAASDKQIGLIVNLAKDVNVSRSDLNSACQKLFNSDLDHISKLNASSLIGDLQKVRDGKLNVASIFGTRPAKAA